jgi:unsaturated rhamnogalacturonyl hydrolase
MRYLEKVYKRTIETADNDLGKNCGMDIWQWDQGVAMYGFVKAYDLTKDDAILEFIGKWLDYHLDKMSFGYSINTTAPLLGMIKLLECGKGNSRYEKICKEFAEWCISECPRADRGTFEHTCTENKYDNQIWADTLFMGCIFLIKYGLYTNNSLFVKEAARQFVLHYKFLSDERTGLIYHGYDCNERMKKGVLWGRGNGWFTIASLEAMELLPKNTPYYDEICNNFKTHFNAVRKYQNEDGSWNTVIDKADTYAEMSVTAAFAYGINKAVKMGIAGNESVKKGKKALEKLKSQIDDAGNVLGGSLGTCVMEDYTKYNDIKCGYTYFTQGLAMMALSFE